jgi:hypothetical protein
MFLKRRLTCTVTFGDGAEPKAAVRPSARLDQKSEHSVRPHFVSNLKFKVKHQISERRLDFESGRYQRERVAQTKSRHCGLFGI